MLVFQHAPNLYETVVKFEMKSGTRQALLDAGARSGGRLFGEVGLDYLPRIERGMTDAVHIKAERGAINYGLRPGSADIFNSRILRFWELS
jgi:hypothetical protein